MTAKPENPKDAAGKGETPRNETLEAALIAKQAEDKAEKADKPRSNKSSFVRGAAVGVGSAALVAALLYANRSRKDKS